MSLAIEQSQPIPLRSDADGVIRVAGTRVTLDTVAYAFKHGATAEEIVQQYPTLPFSAALNQRHSSLRAPQPALAPRATLRAAYVRLCGALPLALRRPSD